ncbi:hypothetical protein ACFVWT_08050 [Arthrobacter sp. NPDC058288]|uniref:hypothetical protein n=1 Tax=Arthrobacter sp. NPDC058288 TaxID=3346424 RepID=UPI0036E13430
MAAFDETSDQSRPAQPRGPVFVDASGRRLRLVKLLGLGSLGLVAAYVVLLVVAFVGGPNVAAPYLPLPARPAAPAAQDIPPSQSAPTSTAAAPAPQAVPAEPAGQAAFQAPVIAPPAVPVTPPAGATGSATEVQKTAPSAPATVPAPATEPTAPGKSGTAPGQAARPSTPPQP